MLVKRFFFIFIRSEQDSNMLVDIFLQYPLIVFIVIRNKIDVLKKLNDH